MRNAGISLLDLLVSLVIVSVLAGIAIPEFQHLAASQRSSAAINRFAGAIALARSAAITYRENVIFCPAEPHTERCGRRNSWHEGALVFADRNGNRRRDAAEPLYARLPSLDHGSVRWRSFRNRSFLQFRGTGLTRWQNGNFLYCPRDNDARHARMLIVNHAGRVRSAPDINGDGVREDAAGRALHCG